jgi:predicted transcriptional regulator
MKRCTVGMLERDKPGGASSDKMAHTVWFASLATLAAVLSYDNRTLRELCATENQSH